MSFIAKLQLQNEEELKRNSDATFGSKKIDVISRKAASKAIEALLVLHWRIV